MAHKKEVYCHYARAWLPLGRSRTRCPRCGAVIDGTGHLVRSVLTKSISQSDRDRMVGEIRKIVETNHRGENLAAACLYWASETVRYLNRQGYRAILQAGTASWPMIDPEQDDGIRPTNFSYIFEGVSAEEAERLLQGKLPEMHVWAAIPARNEIIDLTTRYWPEQARIRCGFEWEGEPPPDYLWTQADRLPEGVIYYPQPQAIKLALDLFAGDEEPLIVTITKRHTCAQ